MTVPNPKIVFQYRNFLTSPTERALHSLHLNILKYTYTIAPCVTTKFQIKHTLVKFKKTSVQI